MFFYSPQLCGNSSFQEEISLKSNNISTKMIWIKIFKNEKKTRRNWISINTAGQTNNFYFVEKVLQFSQDDSALIDLQTLTEQPKTINVILVEWICGLLRPEWKRRGMYSTMSSEALYHIFLLITLFFTLFVCLCVLTVSMFDIYIYSIIFLLFVPYIGW